MHWKPPFAALASALLLLAGPAHAADTETQNGLQVSIAPKTLSRNDARYSGLFTERAINRMMALQIVAKNVSSKAMPEGTVEWQILVLGNAGGATLYSGREPLPALKTAASTELLIGSAQISGWRDASYQRKDKLEYKIIVNHGGSITASILSIPAFEALATHANRIPPPGE